MKTPLETFDALRAATCQLDPGFFSLNQKDATRLRGLSVTDLRSRKYDERPAEEVIKALWDGDFAPLGKSLAVRLEITQDAPELPALPQR